MKPGTTIYIKNMVCQRCVLAVETILREAGIGFHRISVGEAELCDPLPDDKRQALQQSLEKIGLELIDNRKTTTIEKAKQLILKKARNEVKEAEKNQKLSAFLTDQLHLDYSYLSNLFSSVEGRTIEHYFIHQRIEKAKELLVYDQMTLSGIAWELGYSSAAHLSNQFKKVTGLTPSHFKEVGAARRKPLDEA
ncbi:MAG: helix-turn-helix transcriptional regulator [Phaeodactylibacter sp.]|nr:helix-turn-helix transcriptional regulator [Phaeodactylibacter sp.]